VISVADLLQARLHDVTEEHHRERLFSVRNRLNLRGGSASSS